MSSCTNKRRHEDDDDDDDDDDDGLVADYYQTSFKSSTELLRNLNLFFSSF